MSKPNPFLTDSKSQTNKQLPPDILFGMNKNRYFYNVITYLKLFSLKKNKNNKNNQNQTKSKKNKNKQKTNKKTKNKNKKTT